MTTIPICHEDEINLFHLTRKEYIEDIFREGLKKQLTDFTVETFAFYNDITEEEAREELEPLVFAVSWKDLDEPVEK